jgi:hypothetical protein
MTAPHVDLPPKPRTAAHCWPDDCRQYHETWAHLEQEDPCRCPCHVYAATPLTCVLQDYVTGGRCTLAPGHSGHHRLADRTAFAIGC